nr:hypothetical protein [Proteus mirabilis]
MEVLNYGEMGSSISNYIYDSGKLIEIDIKQKEHNKNEIAKYKVYFEYKDDILNRIVDKHLMDTKSSVIHSIYYLYTMLLLQW